MEPVEQPHDQAFISHGVQIVKLRISSSGEVGRVINIRTGPKAGTLLHLGGRPVHQIRALRVQPRPAQIRRAGCRGGQADIRLVAVHPEAAERVPEIRRPVVHGDGIKILVRAGPMNTVRRKEQ